MRDYAELVKDLRCHAGTCEYKETECSRYNKRFDDTDYTTCSEELCDDAANAIEELLAERTAFWVDTQPHMDDSDYKKDGMSYYCSNCHHRAGKYKHRSYKFCPWCGAKIVPKEMAVRNED